MLAHLSTPAERAAPPRSVARVCMNGHFAEEVVPSDVSGIAVNRADPLAVATTAIECRTCGAGTILGCPCCGYPIPGRTGLLAFDVPHFCVVCGEYYPWTFRGEFYATLEEILEEAPALGDDARADRLDALDRLRQGLQTPADLARLTSTFESLGGSDAELAAEILAVVVPPVAVTPASAVRPS